MGHRLSKITTRTGDDGTTGLADGSRLGKEHPRIVALGDIDELNSSIGIVLSHELPPEISTMLTEIQHRLFDLGGELSMPERSFITAEAVIKLDQALQHLNASLPPLKEFILPGGTPVAAHCHLARTICRRAERSVIALENLTEDSAEPSAAQQAGTNMPPWQERYAVAYLNRLSDLLFVIARTLTRTVQADEPLWHSRRDTPETP